MTVAYGIAIGGYEHGVPDRPSLIGLARDVEAAGFDSIHVGDHIQWHAPILEPTTLMATFAAVTERVRIASDVIILPLRDPVLMAKTLASLDVMSDGRIIFGIGLGGDYAREYEVMRIPLKERGSRADESLELIRGLLTHERFSYHGRHFVVSDVEITPRPVQPAIPVWVGGFSDAALRRAAKCGDAWVAAFCGPDKFARLASRLRELRAGQPGVGPAFSFAALVFVNVNADAGRARADAARYIERVYRLDGGRIIDRFGVVGPIGACADKLREFTRVGADSIVLSLACDHRDWRRQVESLSRLIATERGAA